MIATHRDFQLIKCMALVMMGFDIPMTMGTEIVVRARGAFVTNAENRFVAPVAKDVRMDSAVNVGTHAGLAGVVTGWIMGWSP